MNDGRQTVETGAVGLAADGSAPVETSLVAAADRCVACGEMLASDQRYCLQCGERRGRSRFSMAAPSAGPATVASGRRGPRRRPSPTASTTLIAGLGTLLLALGVGVLIGRLNNGAGARSAASPSVQVVTVKGGASPTGGSSGSASTQSRRGSRTGSGHRAARSSAAAPAPAVAHKAAAAASRVLGSKNLPPPTVSVGSHGSGPGFQHHKFTGTFFGH